MSDRTQINWLFEKNVFDDGNPERMAEAAAAGGMRCARAAFECVGGDDQRLRIVGAVPFADDEPVFVYGSMNAMRWLWRQRRWPALAWYDFDRLRCQTYYAHWGEYLLQRRYALLPLTEVARRRDWIFETFGGDGAIFVRPDDNAKSFPGGLVRLDGFEEWYRLANFYDPPPESLAVVATPQVIHAEWRLVIGRRKVVTGSQYRRDGAEAVAPGVRPEVVAFAETVASAGAFEPHPVYVMDVAHTDAGYRLVEIGSACCASLYACDVARVVGAIVEASGPCEKPT